MNSEEVGTWVGNLIATISIIVSVILFVISERNRQGASPKNRGQKSTPSTLIDVGVIDDIRSLVYPRIILGIIIGFAISRLLAWIFLDYAAIDGFFHNLIYSIDMLKVLTSSVLATLLGIFFGLVYYRLSPNFRTIYIHWAERTIVAFILISFLVDPSEVIWTGNGYTVFTANPFLSMFVGVLIMVFISFPLSPVEIVLAIAKKWKEAQSTKNVG